MVREIFAKLPHPNVILDCSAVTSHWDVFLHLLSSLGLQISRIPGLKKPLKPKEFIQIVRANLGNKRFFMCLDNADILMSRSPKVFGTLLSLNDMVFTTFITF